MNEATPDNSTREIAQAIQKEFRTRSLPSRHQQAELLNAGELRKHTSEVCYPGMLMSVKLGIRINRDKGRYAYKGRLPGVLVGHLHDLGYRVRRGLFKTVVRW